MKHTLHPPLCRVSVVYRCIRQRLRVGYTGPPSFTRLECRVQLGDPDSWTQRLDGPSNHWATGPEIGRSSVLGIASTQSKSGRCLFSSSEAIEDSPISHSGSEFLRGMSLGKTVAAIATEAATVERCSVVSPVEPSAPFFPLVSSSRRLLRETAREDRSTGLAKVNDAPRRFHLL